MKKIIAILLLSPLIAFAEAPFEQGSYWEVTSVDVHPGHFDDYISNLNSLWRKQMDQLIKDGKVVSYKLLNNVHGRDGEPDLWLMVEWQSAGAMLDLPDSYWDNMMSNMVGSREEGAKRNIARGELRRIMSTTLTREISFR
ncbi:MAG: hypothetical protein CME40_16635 [Haliea sp.]|nr:hypothetical protein [Haliea sp.]|tara:strand:- start:106324 stop:106746 length:423 start_codon:yes stop_codon:yes gene_type:complete